MLNNKLIEKIIHVSAAKDIENNMDLNEAAEFLDQLDDEIKEKIFVKEEKQNRAPSGLEWILTKTQPMYKYGVAAAMAVLVAVLYINKDTQSSFSISKGFNDEQLSSQTVMLLKKEHKQSKDIVALQDRVDKVLKRVMSVADIDDKFVTAHVISTGGPGAWVLPNGQIIISSEMVKLCISEDELAVILCHELAHIKKGHINNPFKDEKLKYQYRGYLDQLERPISNHLVSEYTNLFQGNESLSKDEITADIEGINLAVLSGYDPNVVFSIFDKAVSAESSLKGYPSKEQRINSMETHFGKIVKDSELFYAGLLYYIKGDLNQSEKLFQSYEQKFPGREVYNNLGVIQYHRGLYRMPLSRVQEIKLIGIDFYTLAENVILRGESTDRFSDYLLHAEREFKKAISADPDYALGHFNLANVYLELQNINYAQFHLSKAEQLGFNKDKCNVLNSSIYIQQKKYDEANSILHSLEKSSEVLFNLGIISLKSGGNYENYFSQFLQSSENFPSVYREFAQDNVKKQIKINRIANLPECDVFHNLTLGDKREIIETELGTPQNTLDLSSRISVLNYPEKSIKIYFEGNHSVFFVNTSPENCSENIFHSILKKSQLDLNTELRNYYSFDGGFIAGDDSGLSLYGKYSN